MQIIANVGPFSAAPGTAPTSLSAIPDVNSVAISFTAPTDNGGESITNYEYSFNNSTWTALSPADAVSPITIGSLSSGTAYTVYLRAVNIIGSGPASTGVAFTTLNPTVATPTLSGATNYNASFYFTITNYDAAVTYNLSTTAGSISRSGSTVTVSGLSANASATASVFGSRSGYNNSATAQRAGSAAAACSCVYQYTQVEGGNCCCTGMCGAANQVCCYNILVYAPASTPCTGGSGAGSCNASIGSWYACDGTC